MSYELHPKTPPQGMLLSERFKGRDLSSFYKQLQSRGNEVGIVFNTHTLLSNSRKALMASEYARDMNKYEAFHENIFHAYFTESLDIGNPDVITAVATKSGLDGKKTLAAASDERYASRLDDVKREGQFLGLTGIPLFIINNQYKIVGAQPLEAFRDFFDKMK